MTSTIHIHAVQRPSGQRTVVYLLVYFLTLTYDHELFYVYMLNDHSVKSVSINMCGICDMIEHLQI